MSVTSVKNFEKLNCDNQEECIKMIQSVLDGSASEAEIQHFKDNIDKCKPCNDHYHLEKAIKNNHKDKVEKKCCPKQTLDALKAKLGIMSVLIVATLIKIKIIHSLFSS